MMVLSLVRDYILDRSISSLENIMNRVLLSILGVILFTILGCGDEEQGFPNPLQIEISTKEEEAEEESPSKGSVTGRIIFADKEGQIRARPLSSNEYVIFQDSSKKVSGKDLVAFVDLPSNNATYVVEGGYFQITDLDPGSHELILMGTTDVLIERDPDTTPEGDFVKIDVPTWGWIVTVEPGRNTAMGPL